MKLRIYTGPPGAPTLVTECEVYTPRMLHITLVSAAPRQRWLPQIYCPEFNDWIYVSRAVRDGDRMGRPGIVFCRGAPQSESDAVELWQLMQNALARWRGLHEFLRSLKDDVSDTIAEMPNDQP